MAVQRNVVETVYSARNKIIELRSALIDAMKNRDTARADDLRREERKIVQQIKKMYGVIIDV